MGNLYLNTKYVSFSNFLKNLLPNQQKIAKDQREKKQKNSEKWGQTSKKLEKLGQKSKNNQQKNGKS